MRSITNDRPGVKEHRSTRHSWPWRSAFVQWIWRIRMRPFARVNWRISYVIPWSVRKHERVWWPMFHHRKIAVRVRWTRFNMPHVYGTSVFDIAIDRSRRALWRRTITKKKNSSWQPNRPSERNQRKTFDLQQHRHQSIGWSLPLISASIWQRIKQVRTAVQRRNGSLWNDFYCFSPGESNGRTRTAKPSDVEWRMIDDDRPISGSGDNLLLKPSLSATREFRLNNNAQANSQEQPSSFYLSRFEQQKRKMLNKEESPSSYFPAPQSDIKMSLPVTTERTQQLYNNNQNKNDRQWKTVPAPPLSSSRRLSDSSIEPSISTRRIPIAPAQTSDDNQYSSTTGTESLGTKITKLATGKAPRSKTKPFNVLVENLNLNKHYDSATTTTLTSETEQGLYSDRQATHRDQTGFFSNRDDPSYECKERTILIARSLSFIPS